MYEIILYNTATNQFKILPAKGLPEEIETSVKVNNESGNVLNIGDVTRPGKPGLRSYSFEFMLPHRNAPEKPIAYLNFLRSALEGGHILQLMISRKDMENAPIFDTNIQVVIDQYKVTEKHGCVGDMFVEMSLKEYRRHETKVIT